MRGKVRLADAARQAPVRTGVRAVGEPSGRTWLVGRAGWRAGRAGWRAGRAAWLAGEDRPVEQGRLGEEGGRHSSAGVWLARAGVWLARAGVWLARAGVWLARAGAGQVVGAGVRFPADGQAVVAAWLPDGQVVVAVRFPGGQVVVAVRFPGGQVVVAVRLPAAGQAGADVRLARAGGCRAGGRRAGGWLGRVDGWLARAGPRQAREASGVSRAGMGAWLTVNSVGGVGGRRDPPHLPAGQGQLQILQARRGHLAVLCLLRARCLAL